VLPFVVHTTDESAWRDAGKRLHRARLVADTPHAEAPQAEVFDGAESVELAAIERAVAAGRHVLVAAEPCLSRAALTAVADAARRRGVLFAMVHPDRFLPSRRLIRKQLDATLGSTELVRSRRWENRVGPASLGLASALVGEIAQAAWLFGRPVRSVFALQTLERRAIQVQLGFAPGMALVDYCDALPCTGAAAYRSLSVIGSRGSAQIDDHTNQQLAFIGGSRPTAVPVGEGVGHLAAMLDDFAQAVAERRDLSACLTDALDTIAAVDAVLQSLGSGEPVSPEVAA